MEDRASLLIVDDERGPAESLRMIFKPSYDVFMANGGEQALEIIHNMPIDVVTLDLRMPSMSGIEVMERIKKFDPDIEVIVVTGYSSLDTAVRGLRFGAFDYISKPFDVPQISDLVGRAVARRRSSLRNRRMKEDFLANLSHELRTPLSAVIGYSAILNDELHDVVTPDQRTALERIQINSFELLNMVEGVLLLNALDAGELAVSLHPFNLNELLARAVDKFRAVASEKGLLVRVDLPPGGVSVISDQEKIERTIWALLDNAVKFTPGGVVSVSLRQVPQENWVEIEVSDTGIGMHSDEAAQALQGLTQVDASPRRRFRGLGIGLRMATRLIDLLGGKIRVVTEVGQGTNFIVTLPLRRNHAAHLH